MVCTKHAYVLVSFQISFLISVTHCWYIPKFKINFLILILSENMPFPCKSLLFPCISFGYNTSYLQHLSCRWTFFILRLSDSHRPLQLWLIQTVRASISDRFPCNCARLQFRDLLHAHISFTHVDLLHARVVPRADFPSLARLVFTRGLSLVRICFTHADLLPSMGFLSRWSPSMHADLFHARLSFTRSDLGWISFMS